MKLDTNYEKSYRIEALVKYNTNIVKDFGGKINFTCLVQLFSTDGNEEIIELEAFEMPSLIGKLSAKLIFNCVAFIFRETGCTAAQTFRFSIKN